MISESISGVNKTELFFIFGSSKDFAKSSDRWRGFLRVST